MEGALKFVTPSMNSLVPARPRYYRDVNNIFPLLANISSVYPDEAIDLGIKSLQETA